MGSFTRRESFKITRRYYYFHAWTVIYSRRVALLLAVYTDDAAPGVFNEDEEGWKDDGSAPLIIMIVSTLLYTSKYIAERERERCQVKSFSYSNFLSYLVKSLECLLTSCEL